MDTLYQSVADRMQGMIDEGALRPGDRIPSVRRLHQQWAVSVSTVLEAYRLLEDRGLVEARPRSGYYVRAHPRSLLDEPSATAPPRRPQRVRTNVVMRMHAEVADPSIVQLGAAVPDPHLLPVRVLARKVGEVMRRRPEASHGYLFGQGSEALRRQIARRMLDAGCTVPPADLVVTGGGQEALFLSLKAVTQPGDMVAVESPTYYGLLEAMQILDLRALELPTHPRDGVDLDGLEEALRLGGVKACALVSNYSNPLGSCMDDDKKRALAETVAHYRVPLIEDDIFGELPHEGPRPRAIKAFDRAGMVLYCSSFSKTLSPGFRIGWAIPGRLVQEVTWLKSLSSIAAPTVPQLAIAAYLGEGGYDHHLRKLRRVYRENLARAIAAVSRHFPSGTRATRPSGGQLLWVEMPVGADAVRLYEQATPYRVSLAPGVLFSPSGRHANCLRLNLGLVYDERVEAALETLGRLAGEQVG